MDFSAALLGTLSPDQNVREQGTKLLEKAAEDNLGGYLTVLCQELVNEEREVHVRVAAGLSVKNSLVAKDPERRARLIGKWKSLGGEVRSQVKQLVLKGLETPNGAAGTAAAQVVSAIAFIELPSDEWPELMGILLENVTGTGRSACVRKATLESIGFICEQIDPEILEARSNEILTAVINGLRSAEGNIGVRVAAARALLNSVDFIRKNFESVQEATIIMQVVCEATISTDETLAVASFECLNEIVSVYYEKMGPFIPEGVAQMTISVLETARQRDSILLQAVEFWSTLAEIEAELSLGEIEQEDDGASTSNSYYFVHRYSKVLLPPLLRLLEEQPSEDSTDEWCPSMAASTCLGLVAEALGDAIFETPIVQAFIEEKINAPKWQSREAAVMALGSILDGPSTDSTGSLIDGNIRRLVELLANDSSVAVQDSAAWAIGRICDFHLSAVQDSFIPMILQALTHCLAFPPRVSVNCCWSLMTICTHLGAEDDSVPTSHVSPLFGTITGALVSTADRGDSDEANLRSAAYQSLAAVLLNAPADKISLVAAMQEPLVGRLETALQHLSTAVVNADDRNRLYEVLSHLCTVMQSAVKKCSGPADQSIADRTMQVALSLLQAASASAGTSELEDVLLLVGVLANEMDESFVRFMPYLVPLLLPCLGRHEDTSLCSVTVGLVGDLARANGPLIQPHLNDLLGALVAGLNSQSLHRSVKPHIISAIGDLCLASGSAFLPYLDLTMAFLIQASSIQVSDEHDFDEIDFCLALRESLLEAYTCLVQGLRQDSDGQALLKYLPAIITFLQMSSADPERTESMARSIAGLLGDISEAFGGHLGNTLKAPWVSAFLQRPIAGRLELAPQTVSVIQWAHQILTK